MAGRLPKPTEGELIRNSPPGFPAFFERRKPRIITANPWAFLRQLAAEKLPYTEEKTAIAYIDQALDFYNAAANPHLGSKPLLYYYSFLNLAKAALLIRKVKIPPRVSHGIEDPKINVKERLRLEGQKVRIKKLAYDHSQVFPEFVRMLGVQTSRVLEISVLNLFAQIPCIHRTFCTIMRKKPNFVPIERIDLLKAKSRLWARIIFKRDDKDVQATLPKLRRQPGFKNFARQVDSNHEKEIWFETTSVPGQGPGIDGAIKRISDGFRSFGASSILTAFGYHFYFCTLPRAQRLPQLAAALAIVFYLGSITRYKPDVFDKIIAGNYAWIVEEFLSMNPMQFLYTLASELARVDVVRPYATIQ